MIFQKMNDNKGPKSTRLMTTDASPTYDCPKCNGVRTVIDAGDAQHVFWCKNCRSFFMEFQLKAQMPPSD